MDDAKFEEWSEKLSEIRQTRHGTIKAKIEDHASGYTAKDLFDFLMLNMDQILTQWWSYEKKSWEEEPPADLNLAIENLQNELNSVTDFEIEAIKDDISHMPATNSIKSDEVAQGLADLETFAAEIKRNYLIKIDGLAATVNKKNNISAGQAVQAAPVMRQRVSRGGGGGSGFALVVMFLVGLVAGGGASFYFYDQANRAQVKFTELQDQQTERQKEFISNMTLLQETYYQLATGKIMNLTELDRAIKPLLAERTDRKRQIEEEFARAKENLLKKIPAGDRLDRTLEKLTKNKETDLAAMEASIERRLEPYLKQKEIHDALMKQ